MKTLCLLLLAAVTAPCALAQRGVDLLLDAEGVRRTGKTQVAEGTQQLDPQFSNGWGAGVGVNVWLSDRFSIEAKAAGFRSHLQVITRGSDFIAIADLGHAQIYPLTAVLQWHPFEHGLLRPYIGAGGAHIILRNVNRKIGNSGATGIKFSDPTGLLIDGGIRVNISKRWDAYGDVRYVPLETRGNTTFPGTTAQVQLHVKPVIAGFGIAYRY
jgi:outer membrane protein W